MPIFRCLAQSEITCPDACLWCIEHDWAYIGAVGPQVHTLTRPQLAPRVADAIDRDPSNTPG